MSSVLIIGAGLSGLIAARTLTAQNHQVMVLDKGRGVGGRLATRRLGEGRADHGAQYFSAKTPEFQQQVSEWLAAGVVREWHPEAAVVGDTQFNHPRYVGTDGMSGIAKALATGLAIQQNERVTQLQAVNGGWQVHTESGKSYPADVVLCTVPAPQALTLLNDSGLDPVTIGVSALSAIHYQPCITVLATLNEPSRIPAPGGIRFETGPVAWVADNQQKGISTLPTLTIQAGAAFSQARLAYTPNDTDALAAELIGELPGWLTPSAVDSVQVHRWRYSLADERYPEPLLPAQTSAPLVFGGDGFGMGNVEGAFLSGRAMGEWVKNAIE